jgi:hypothetical protein
MVSKTVPLGTRSARVAKLVESRLKFSHNVGAVTIAEIRSIRTDPCREGMLRA